MNKREYTNNKIVLDFIDWIIPRISGEVEFLHQYVNNKDKSIWRCYSIFNAYENYKWPFSTILPDKSQISGQTFKESKQVLNVIEDGMKSAIRQKDYQKLYEYSYAVLKWGGVTNKNDSRLINMGENIIPYFQNAISNLNPKTVKTEDDFSGIIMNSGFTKLYSLVIDDFIIYDSRVGAALGLLVKQYLTERNVNNIPEVLNFAYGYARTTKPVSASLNRRNPSNNTYKFPTLNNNNKKHIKNNIYANWLLKELSEKSSFKHESNSIRKLESALFMIGYAVNDKTLIKNFT